MFIGRSGGAWDARIARPGYSADLDDPTDRKKISFAASRGSLGRVAEVGTMTSFNTWYPLSGTYTDVQAFIFAVRRNGALVNSVSDTLSYVAGAGNNTTINVQNGSTYVLVLGDDGANVAIVRPTVSLFVTGDPYSVTPGDQFTFFSARR